MKKISIITPVYNSVKSIKLFLDGINNQELPYEYSLELLVCDDSSTDGTVQILDIYKFSSQLKSLILFRNVENKGISYSTNLLLDNVSGHIIVFIDSDVIPLDDQWLKNITKRIVDGESCVVVGNFWKQYNNSPLTESHERWRKTIYLRRYRYNDNQLKNINTRNAAFAGKIIDNINNNYGYFLDKSALRAGGDTELATRVIKDGYKIYYCEQASAGHIESRSYIDLIKQKARHGYGDGKLSIKYKKNFLYSIYYPYVDGGVPIFFSIPITIVFVLSNLAGLLMRKNGVGSPTMSH